MRAQDRRLTAKRTARNERVRVVAEDAHGASDTLARLQSMRLDAVVLRVPAVELCALASALTRERAHMDAPRSSRPSPLRGGPLSHCVRWSACARNADRGGSLVCAVAERAVRDRLDVRDGFRTRFEGRVFERDRVPFYKQRQERLAHAMLCTSVRAQSLPPGIRSLFFIFSGSALVGGTALCALLRTAATRASVSPPTMTASTAGAGRQSASARRTAVAACGMAIMVRFTVAVGGTVPSKKVSSRYSVLPACRG